MQPLGIYISVPFCRAKCTFCNFASGAFALDRMETYVAQIVAEIRRARQHAAALGTELPASVDSLYFGGGTPSLLTPPQLRAIFAALHSEFALTADAEITLECAPGQMAPATLAAAVALGVNRVSFGVQSFVDAESAAVGRLHTADLCLEEIANVRTSGIHAISLDLIAGMPGQTAASWEYSLDTVIATQVPHASLYMLEIDEDSRLGKELIGGGVRYGAALVPTDDAVADFYARGCECFEAAGLLQYEISNFARPGCESRHNLKYWDRSPYLGFGVDAHSMLRLGLKALRFANPDSLEAYAEATAEDAAPPEVTLVDAAAAFEEALFLGLRRNIGVSLADLAAEFGESHTDALRERVAELTADGVLTQHSGRIQLTARGRAVSNEVFSELLCAVAD